MVDRQLWKKTFNKYDVLQWPCPTCKNGTIHLNNQSLQLAESKASVEARNHEEWEPEWTTGRFCCLLYCKDCGEVISVAGRYTVDYLDMGEDRYQPQVFERFEPLFFSDAPDIFTLPEVLPKPIAIEIRKAFDLYWIDSAASANRIRSSVEMLLTDMKVKRYNISKGKRNRLNLHDRIKLLGGKRPELADRLYAIKWLGNAGSHTSSIDKDDLLDAFDILDYVLDDTYMQRHKKISKIVREINKAKGPRSRTQT